MMEIVQNIMKSIIVIKVTMLGMTVTMLVYFTEVWQVEGTFE